MSKRKELSKCFFGKMPFSLMNFFQTEETLTSAYNIRAKPVSSSKGRQMFPFISFKHLSIPKHCKDFSGHHGNTQCTLPSFV